MLPAYAQVMEAPTARQGFPPIFTALPGVHNPMGLGTQGCGVKTPNAAEVAEATMGFTREVHIPQVPTLLMGATSCTVAMGFPPALQVSCDVTFNTPVPTPIVHIIVAPLTTVLPTEHYPFPV